MLTLNSRPQFITPQLRDDPPRVQELVEPKPECPRKKDKISFNLEFIKTLTTVKLGLTQVN